MPPTEVIESHREPTHPPVIPRHFGEGQRLPDLAPVAQATGPVVPFDDTRVNLLIAQQRQHMLQTGFAIEGTYCDPLDLMPFILLLHLTIGQPLRPTEDRTGPPALRTVARGRVTTPESLQDS